jgi:DNA-binding response OmpR family regulator
MRCLKRIVFFWVGQDVSIPEMLVRSIRLAFGADMEVVQISDRDTPQVDGVSVCRREKLSPRIMVARLEAYASLAVKEPTLYLDADMMIVRPFDLPPLQANEIGVTSRTDRTEINWRFPIEFPEFQGKYFSDVMPYIYSFVYASSEVLFVRQLNLLRKMSKRFQLWYGDQVTLKRELDSGRYVLRSFNVDTHNHTVRSVPDYQHAVATIPDLCIAHFKGPQGKQALAEILRGLHAQRA